MKIGLLGYGKMGRGIFHLFQSPPFSQTVLVRTAEKAEVFNRQVETRLKRSLRKGLMNEDGFRERLEALRFTNNFEDLASSDIVIESLPEEFETKVEFLKRAEGVVSSDSLLVTNSSGLPISALAERMQAGGRFCGLHFFHPIPLTSIVEIIEWDGVAVDTVERLRKLCLQVEKHPVVVRDFPGSVVNPILAGYYCEGLYLLEQGVLPSRIDEIAYRLCRVGPCESIDALGVGFFDKLFRNLKPHLPQEMAIPALLGKLIGDGRLGKESGAGIFLYTGEGVLDGEREYYIDPMQEHSSREPEEDADAIAKRLQYAVLGALLFAVGKGLGGMEDLDFAVREVLGMGTGPLDLVKEVGKEGLKRDFTFLSERGESRFNPSLVEILPGDEKG